MEFTFQNDLGKEKQANNNSNTTEGSSGPGTPLVIIFDRQVRSNLRRPVRESWSGGNVKHSVNLRALLFFQEPWV